MQSLIQKIRNGMYPTEKVIFYVKKVEENLLILFVRFSVSSKNWSLKFFFRQFFFVFFGMVSLIQLKRQARCDISHSAMSYMIVLSLTCLADALGRKENKLEMGYLFF